MFAARAGAKAVYAVEYSNIAFLSKQIVQDNGFGGIIHVIHGKMEEIELPVPTVDIIISEWMGYFLVYESSKLIVFSIISYRIILVHIVLPSVLFARDKYLNKQSGIIMPDQALLYLCAIEDAEYKKEKVSRLVIARCLWVQITVSVDSFLGGCIWIYNESSQRSESPGASY